MSRVQLRAIFFRKNKRMGLFLLLGIVKSLIFLRKMLKTTYTFVRLIFKRKELLPYAKDFI
jgi:hypothetical protein